MNRAIDMPRDNNRWIKALGLATAATALAGLTACASMMTKPPELISGSETQVVIVADLHSSPRPLAKSHCAQYGKRAMLNDTAPAAGNLLRGWAIGTKVFIYTFDCRQWIESELTGKEKRDAEGKVFRGIALSS